MKCRKIITINKYTKLTLKKDKWNKISETQQNVDQLQILSIDVKTYKNQHSFGEILKMIRVLIFKNKLFDIEASEVEYRLKEFWLNSDDEHDGSNDKWYHGYLNSDKAYPDVEETLVKDLKGKE